MKNRKSLETANKLKHLVKPTSADANRAISSAESFIKENLCCSLEFSDFSGKAGFDITLKDAVSINIPGCGVQLLYLDFFINIEDDLEKSVLDIKSQLKKWKEFDLKLFRESERK